MIGPRGYERPDGRAGIRNHLLVLPSVVCSTHAAREIADGVGAVAIVHQHGCLHVGDDLAHTERVLMDAALNPNVGAVLIVGLGCETLQGFRLARRLGELRPAVDYVGLQAEGGTAAAVARGRAIAAQRLAELAETEVVALAARSLLVGLDGPPGDPLVEALEHELGRRGLRTVIGDGGDHGATHVGLAGLGAQVIVSLCGTGEAPLGFALCPVIAVGRDLEMYAALADDFDLVAVDGDPSGVAARVVDRVLAVSAGERTASEERGATDFVIKRIAVTM